MATINMWFAGQVMEDDGFRRVHTMRDALEEQSRRIKKQGHQGRHRAEPERSVDTMGSGTYLEFTRAVWNTAGSCDCIWDNLGMSMFSRDWAAH